MGSLLLIELQDYTHWLTNPSLFLQAANETGCEVGPLHGLLRQLMVTSRALQWSKLIHTENTHKAYYVQLCTLVAWRGFATDANRMYHTRTACKHAAELTALDGARCRRMHRVRSHRFLSSKSSPSRDVSRTDETSSEASRFSWGSTDLTFRTDFAD